MTPSASLRVALLTLLVTLVTCDRVFVWYAERHFIPEARLRAALAKGPGCTVVAGDSRMVVGVNEERLGNALREAGRNECVASIALGALPIHGIRVAVREYIKRGGKPRTLALGASEDTLLRAGASPDPSGLVGNEAISLAWSELGDVKRLYPGFPFANVRAFDQGLRFSLARATGLGTYASLVWQKVQAVQDRLTGKAQASNTFGALVDMEGLAKRMQATAHDKLELTLEHAEELRFDPAFEDIEDRARSARASFVLVELPMPDRYRTAVTESGAGQRYLGWLRGRVTRRGGTFLDLTHPAWLAPTDFGDFLHLNADGAAHFSAELGHALARVER